MARRGVVAEWVADWPARSFFTPADVPASAAAVESSLSRLAAVGGPIQRVRQGLYWKKPPGIRFGTPVRIRPMPRSWPFARAPAWRVRRRRTRWVVYPGFRLPAIAVVGRPPKGLAGVRFTSRANPQRIHLTRLEVTVLEALRDFPAHSEVSWPEARDRIRKLAADGRIDLGQLAVVGAGERRAGLAERIAELAGK